MSKKKFDGLISIKITSLICEIKIKYVSYLGGFPKIATWSTEQPPNKLKRC